MTDLRPCPFCGGEANIEVSQTYDRDLVYSIRCSKCNGGMGERRRVTSFLKGNLYFKTEKEVVEAWNTRYTDDGGK